MDTHKGFSAYVKTKFCKDCRFAFNDGSEPEGKELQYLLCGNERVSPRVSPEYLVTGARKCTFCTTERAKPAGNIYPCGQEGNLWEAKDEQSQSVQTLQ